MKTSSRRIAAMEYRKETAEYIRTNPRKSYKAISQERGVSVSYLVKLAQEFGVQRLLSLTKAGQEASDV